MEKKRGLTRREFLAKTAQGAGVLAASSILAACGQTPAPTAVSTKATTVATAVPTSAPVAVAPVKLIHWDSNPNSYRTKAYKLAGEWFNRQFTNVTVEYVPVPVANYQEKLQAAIAAGNPPDVGDMWFNWMARYVSQKALLDLEPYLPSWKKLNDFSPSHLKLSRVVDNKMYVVAHDIFLQGTHYRKDLVKEAGLEDPRELDKQGKWDWAAFSKVAKALNKPDKNVFGVSMRGGIGGDFTIFNMMISATKGKWFDDKGNCTLNSPEALSALEWYSGLATDLKVAQPSAATDGFQEFTNYFYKGNAGMMIHNDDGINGLIQLGPEKYASAQMPASPVGTYMGMVGYGAAAFAATKNPQIAAQFAFYFVETAVERETEGRKQDGQKVEVMPLAPMISDLKNPLLSNPLYEAFYDIPNKAPERSFVNPFWLADYDGITAQMVVPDFQKILTGKMKAKEAADRWAEAFTKAQKEYLAKK